MGDWPQPPAPGRKPRGTNLGLTLVLLALAILTTAAMLAGIFGDQP